MTWKNHVFNSCYETVACTPSRRKRRIPSRSTLRQSGKPTSDIQRQRSAEIRKMFKSTSKSKSTSEAILPISARCCQSSSSAMMRTSISENAVLSPRAFEPKRIICRTLSPKASKRRSVNAWSASDSRRESRSKASDALVTTVQPLQQNAALYPATQPSLPHRSVQPNRSRHIGERSLNLHKCGSKQSAACPS